MTQDLAMMAQSYGVPNPAGLPSIPMPPMPDMDAGGSALPPQLQAQSPMGQPTPGAPQGMPPPAPPQPPDLASLYAKWQPEATRYDRELMEARRREQAEQEAFSNLIRQSTEQKTQAPSQAELYFRLAAAFGAPTRTGNFFESLANAGTVMADHEKEKRLAAGADKKNALNANIELRKIGLQSAKDETSNLRALALEESRGNRALALDEAKGKREMEVKIRAAEIEANKAKSEAGKIAEDMGLTRGSKEYATYVEKYSQEKVDIANQLKLAQIAASQAAQGVAAANLGLNQMKFQFDQEKDLANREQKAKNAAKLTPAEVKLKEETENMVAATDSALGNVKKALALNDKTYDSSLPDRGRRLAQEAIGSKDEKLKNTRLQENLLSQQALDSLKTVFGGAPTEGERAILLSLQGINAKSVEERKEIIKNLYIAIRQRQDRYNKRLNNINSGRYRDTHPGEDE